MFYRFIVIAVILETVLTVCLVIIIFLCSAGGWLPSTSDANQWIMADLLSLRHVTSVITQGRGPNSQHTNNQWVTSYKILHSLDNLDWFSVKNADDTEKIFAGNNDINTKIENRFSPGICCRYVKLQIVTWNEFICIRWDLKGF